jgi:predicted LPLAT superfamily acyltransferase
VSEPAPRLSRYIIAERSEWRAYPERGSRLLLRMMASVSLRLGRPAGRVILYGIAGYFFLFAPAARRRMREYLRRALGREARAGDRFRLIMNFASTIHDRLYLLAGRYELFDISIQGEPLIREVVAAGGGAFLMGAHVGSFEVLRAIGARQPGLVVTMVMYEGNARKLNGILAAAAPERRPQIISLGRLDAMLQLQQRLDEGSLVGVLGDRTLGEEPALPVTFLGATAYLPVGPMRAAAVLRRRVVFMLGLYRGGNRYHAVFEPLADFSATPPGQAKAAIEAAITRFVALLEQYCRSDPYNWFNFFDFWRSSARPSAHRPPQPPELPEPPRL